ncbi:MAG: GatB/YqeY domain-containing protein [Dehalococcoidia bacterium]
MSLKERLAADLYHAMRQREELRRDTLRMTLAAVHNAEIEARAQLDDEAILNVLSKEAKMRRESIEEFKKGGRQDLVDKETAELEIISAYLPQQLSRDEIVEVARQVVQETGASGQKDIGKVMPALMQRLQGRADGRIASEVVRELLSGS